MSSLPTIPNLAVFIIATALIIVGALFVVLNKSPVNSALGLLTTFLGVAVFYVQLEAHFLAAVQIIVYASAVVILFLFVIMLVGVRDSDKPKIQSFIIVSIIFAGILILADKYNIISGKQSQVQKNNSAIDNLANVLFTHYAWPFLILTGLLVASVVGAVALVNKSEEVEKVEEK